MYEIDTKVDRRDRCRRQYRDRYLSIQEINISIDFDIDRDIDILDW